MFQSTYPFRNNACRCYGMRSRGESIWSLEVVFDSIVDEAVIYPTDGVLILMRVEVV